MQAWRFGAFETLCGDRSHLLLWVEWERRRGPAGRPADGRWGGPPAPEAALGGTCTARAPARSPWPPCSNHLRQEGADFYFFPLPSSKRLWSEILSNGVRSILHRPPITIAEWWLSIAEFNSWLKNDRFHFPLLTQPATSWCSTSIFKIFPRFTVFSLFIIQSNSRVYNA